jgi:Family of unknown function (DUF5906)
MTNDTLEQATPINSQAKAHALIAYIRKNAVPGAYPMPPEPSALPEPLAVEPALPAEPEPEPEPTKEEPEEDKGPEVALGINLMDDQVEEEIGPVRWCEPPGLIQKYLRCDGSNLEQLAGVVGQLVVVQKDGYWVRSERGWTPETLRSAKGKVKAMRGEFRDHGIKCTYAHLDAVFPLLPVVDGTLTSPVRSDFVKYRGLTYLNQRLAPRLEPTKFGAMGALYRDFIIRNILNDQRPIAEIERELADPTAVSPTRWALHWIVHLYQNPGCTVPASLWLVSVAQGIGKTLFGRMLKVLIGEANATQANQSEMTGEWSDWMLGYSLIIADEINVVEKKSFYAKLKGWIGSDEQTVRKRSVGSWTIPSIAHYLFFTNNLKSISIDQADRRIMMIECTNDLDQANRVLAPLLPIVDDADQNRAALAELGAWLDQISIDKKLINRAISTTLKEDLIESTRDPVDSFVMNQIENKAWKPGEWFTTSDLMQRYSAYCSLNEVFVGFRSQMHLTDALQRLKRHDWVRPERRSRGRGWVLKNPPVPEQAENGPMGEIVQLPRDDSIYERMKRTRNLMELKTARQT